ncbi:MAG TPA: hypothetical protein VNZ58_06370 [Thermomicrobiales bacterium]|nr:hypothetical protein [Thermomicrobiales bacterium]
MSGNDPNNDHEWYVLKNEATEESAGLIDAHGNTRETSPETESRVREAFAHDLTVKNGEVLEDFGMCFDGVCSITPNDPEHDALVLKNLGALTGFRPEHRDDE